MNGYLDAPADSADMFTPDGWLRTGDLGHIDPDGNVVLTGRLKDLIKVNGLQVSPTEVEEALLAQPGITDAAVIGSPDERTGETPIAFIVTAPHSAIDLERIRAAVDEHLAPYKRPTAIHIVDQLPRTPSGKLIRRMVAASAAPTVRRQVGLADARLTSIGQVPSETPAGQAPRDTGANPT